MEEPVDSILSIWAVRYLPQDERDNGPAGEFVYIGIRLAPVISNFWLKKVIGKEFS
jgi:hypothetical protein